MSEEPVIEVSALTKVFGKGEDAVKALDGVSFTVRRGTIVGLLGPNGAGKTTTIQHLLGLTTPTSGVVKALGLDVAKHRRKILARVNFASAAVSLPSNLTAYENLSVFARLYGLSRPRAKIEELLELFEITETARRKTGALSSGQQTRLNLCKAFLNDPEILYLDEPTASLDPNIAAKVRDTLKAIQERRGVTMVYTSHNMAEVEQICQEVIFLNRGRIVAQGPPGKVMAESRSASLEEVFIAIARDEERFGWRGRS